MSPADALISRDRILEIWDCLTPTQRVAAVLRMEGLTDGQIGLLLGISAQAVAHRMVVAKKRILRQYPELKHLLDGRKRYDRSYVVHMRAHRCTQTPDAPPLEYGWICNWDGQPQAAAVNRGDAQAGGVYEQGRVELLATS